MTPPATSAATIAQSQPSEIVYLGIADVLESPTNPRKHFDQKKLEELAESIGKVGVLQPVLVRPHPAKPGRHELVFGARRYRAAKLAGQKTIPVIVRTLTDGEVLEAQVIENLQREDVHPLEEADGYAQLMDKHGYTAESLAAKVGKSKAYVYARLKLRALGKGPREMFFAGELDASTALLVARIPDEKLQAKAAAEITESHYGGAKLSYRQAAEYVQKNYMLRLADAPFDVKSTTLVPAAGACGACPHRTGNQKELFGDVKGADVCTNPPCFEKKKAADWDTKSATAKKLGLRVLSDKEAQVALNSYSTAGEYAPLSAEVLSGHSYQKYSALVPSGKRPPAVAVARDERGKVVELFKRADLNKAAKLEKPKRFNERTQSYGSYAPSKEQILKQRGAAEGQRRALAAMVAHVEKGQSSKALLQGLALCAVGAMWADTIKAVVERRGFDQLTGQGMRGNAEEVLRAAVKHMGENQLRGLVFELLTIQSRHRINGIAYATVMKAAKVDPKKHEAAAIAELRKEAKEREAKKKAAAKAKEKKPAKPTPKKPAPSGKPPEKTVFLRRRTCARPECKEPAEHGKQLCALHTETPARQGICKHCGCTNTKPCEDENGDAACGWTDATETECTACVKVG